MSKQNNLKDFIQGLVDAVADKKGLVAGTINAQDLEEEIRSIQGTGDSNYLTRNGELVYNPVPTINEDGELVFEQKMYVYNYELTDKPDTTATADDILLGKTAYLNDELVEGTIETYDYSTDEGGDSVDLIEQLNNDTLISYSNSNITKLRQNIFFMNEKLESISLPNCVEIGNQAFWHAENLKQVYLPNVTKIGSIAFDHTSLTEFDFSKITSYESQAFTDTKLKNAYIPLVTSLPNNAMSYCPDLESFSAPLATTMGDYAFQYDKKLTQVNLPKMTNVSTNAFISCVLLTMLKLPLVNTIKSGAFKETPMLVDIYLGHEGLISLANTNAFQNVGTTQGYVNIHVRPEYADQYTTATNWSSLIAEGKIIIIGDYKEE